MSGRADVVHFVAIASIYGKPNLAGYILQPHRTRLTFSVNETTDRMSCRSPADFDDAQQNHCCLAGCGPPDQLDSRCQMS